MRSRRWSVAEHRRLLVVIGVALATSLIVAFATSGSGGLADAGIDPYGYGEMGESVAAGDGFEGFGSVLGRRTPLYPLLIGALYAVFGVHPNVVVLVQCVMFAATAALTADMARRHFGQRTGVIAGLMVALNPLLLRYIPSLHVETMLTFMFTLMVWCAYRYWQRPTVR
ncbi:MAG: ArnT family glycosyltransferase, partial [Desertimonas sp.]